MIKVIIDTDIGDDIDDALALALALSSKELELLGVTTVYRNVKLRAMLASKLLKLYGRGDIPVAMGFSNPLIEDAIPRDPPQAKALDLSEDYPNIVNKHAVEFLREIIENENEVTIITIGPLTNIAVLLRMYPHLIDKTNLIVMGGYLSYPMAEYNIKCDPEAAYIVFNSHPRITMIGLDVTLKCAMYDDMLEKLTSSSDPRLRFLSKLYKYWCESSHMQVPIMHDPLAVVVSFRRDLVSLFPYSVKVELFGRHTRGLTIPIQNANQEVEVALEVKVDDFMELYTRRVLEG